MTSTIGHRAEDTARADDMLALVISDGTVLSWEEVFDEYAPALTFYARSRGVREPEDLVQDVFVAAFKHLPRFAGDRSGLRSLLFTIAYRRIADHHRRCYRRPETLVAEHSPRADPGPTVEQIVDLGEAAQRAMQAFAVLSERERRVIQMRILEEDSPASVGRALGLSSANVRVIQARALVKIRKHLRSIGDGGFALPMFTFGALSDSFRYLGAELPGDGPLGQWIEALRSNPPNPTLEATTSATSVAIGPNSAAVTGRAADTAYSLASAVISSGASRIGAAVSAVVLSTVPLLPAVFLGTESPAPSAPADPVVEVRQAESTPPFQLDIDAPVDAVEQPADHSVSDDAATVGSPAVEEPQPSSPVPADDVVPGADPASAEAQDPELPEATMPELVEDVVEPLVVDTVDTLDDAVVPLVDVVVVVVEDTVDVVDDTVHAVEDVVEDVVENAGQPLPGDLTVPLDDVVPGVGGLLGGG